MRVLLHVCCAPCATTALERLLAGSHVVTLFFSNHNIDTLAEHDLRLRHVARLADHFGVPLLVDPRASDVWRSAVAGYESAPERGSRCAQCFRYSLGRTRDRMLQDGLDAFTTTLTVSPHKIAAQIFQIGGELAGERFLALDFKKNDGFKRSLALSRELELYRQSYCGCIFSRHSG